MDVLVATDFFTAEVWTMAGLVTYYVLFFIHHAASRRAVKNRLQPFWERRYANSYGYRVTHGDKPLV